MGIFKTRQNKKFSYSPRYWENEGGEGSPYQIKSKFDGFRSTVGKNKNVKDKFMTAWDELRHDSDSNVNKRVLIIALILIVTFLFLIDFDLSIFTARQ